MSSTKVLEYKKVDSKEEIYELWNIALGKVWLLTRNDFFQKVFDRTGNATQSVYYVAENSHTKVGFIAARYKDNLGQIVCIFVHPEYQRKGVGTHLLNNTVSSMKSHGVKSIQTGVSVGEYFWPGVPTNLQSAIQFFKKNHWSQGEENIDMLLDLKDYYSPPGTYEKLDKEVVISILGKNQLKQLLDFVGMNFPDWRKYYEKELDQNNYKNILVAANKSGEIYGAMILFTEHFLWKKMINGKVGGFGALGVKETARGKGIGLALSAKATEQLKQRGMNYSFLGWTYLAGWYGKLGYNVWRRYNMFQIDIRK